MFQKSKKRTSVVVARDPVGYTALRRSQLPKKHLKQGIEDYDWEDMHGPEIREDSRVYEIPQPTSEPILLPGWRDGVPRPPPRYSKFRLVMKKLTLLQ